MNVDIGQPAETQDISFTDSISVLRGDPNYCGARKYSLSPNYTFLTIAEPTLSLFSSNVSDAKLYKMQLTVSLNDFPSITKTINFDATIYCRVYDITVNKAPPSPPSISTYKIMLDSPL